eukprot:jgi/Chrpa1/25067/Chrysochromulina_OHIO_Genome00002872-RA
MTTIETHEANEPMTFPAESLMMTTHDKDKYVVVLPCWGSPYIHGIVRKKGMTGDELNLLRPQGGNVALVVPKRVFEMLCPNPRTMMLYKNPKTSDEGENGLENGCWEFGDEEETDKATKYFEEKGYDFEEDIGFCWLAKFYSSDEEEDESDASDMF